MTVRNGFFFCLANVWPHGEFMVKTPRPYAQRDPLPTPAQSQAFFLDGGKGTKKEERVSGARRDILKPKQTGCQKTDTLTPNTAPFGFTGAFGYNGPSQYTMPEFH